MHVHDSLTLLDRAVDAVAAVDWDNAEPGAASAALADLVSLRRRLEALGAGLLLALERSGDIARDGYRTSSGWLSEKTRTAEGRARFEVGLARRVAAMPEVAAAWCSGTVGLEQVTMLADARKGREHAFAAAAAWLVRQAETLVPEDLATVLAKWRDTVDPEAGADDRDARDERRSLHASPTKDAMTRLDGWLEPKGGAEFSAELGRLTEAELATDWAQARQLHGDDATIADLRRTPAQRRADALLRMAQRSASFEGAGLGSRWVINVLVDEATLQAAIEARATGRAPVYPTQRTCELLDGTVLTPAEVLDQALEGYLRRVVFGTDGHVLEFGRTTRFHPGPVRDAIVVRDRRCRERGCRRAAHLCQIDHRVEWEDGGETGERNGEALCGPANRFKHWLKCQRRRGRSGTQPQRGAVAVGADALRQWGSVSHGPRRS